MNKKIIKQSFIVIIYGPTGVGKTDVALTLAHHFPSEIINMDVGQFYVPLSIGTAKPDWKKESTPHHLFDIIDSQSNYTVTEYRNKVQTTIKDIINRGNLPILVGGSGFYLHTLLFPPHTKTNEYTIQTQLLTKNSQELWDTLYSIDPQRAEKINKNDTYRIKRALEIWTQTGQLPTSFVPYYEPLADYLLLYVIRDTSDLNEYISKRIHVMIQKGWIDETKKLMGTLWQTFIQKKKLIGYNEIFNFLQGNQDRTAFNSMIELINNKTRQYAKRQRTFWRKLEREIKQQINYNGSYIGCLESLNLTNTDLQLYINELLKRLVKR